MTKCAICGYDMMQGRGTVRGWTDPDGNWRCGLICNLCDTKLRIKQAEENR